MIMKKREKKKKKKTEFKTYLSDRELIQII